MKIAQELRSGSTIKIGEEPFVVLKAEYNKSGRNAAVVKFKMKSLLSGNISDSVYKADDKMDDIRLDKVKAVYSYNDGSFYVRITSYNVCYTKLLRFQLKTWLFSVI